MALIFLAIMICSCEAIIEADNISNREVNLLAPTDNADIDTTHIQFFWEIVQDAEYYQIQVATPSFEEALQIVVDSTLYGNEFNATLNENSYEWRVRALNSGYETGYSTNSFTVQEE